MEEIYCRSQDSRPGRGCVKCSQVRRTPGYQLEIKAYLVAALDLPAGLVSLVALSYVDLVSVSLVAPLFDLLLAFSLFTDSDCILPSVLFSSLFPVWA